MSMTSIQSCLLLKSDICFTALYLSVYKTLRVKEDYSYSAAFSGMTCCFSGCFLGFIKIKRKKMPEEFRLGPVLCIARICGGTDHILHIFKAYLQSM